MKKMFLLWFVALLLMSSCQDEFCLDATTPNLVVRFYDNSDNTIKKPLQLTVWANNLDTIYNDVSTDSIGLPLDTQNNTVVYHLSTTNNQEDITINYTIEDIFVSKACGFKSIFNNFTINTTSNNWLINSEVLTTSISNQHQAHVKIYH